MSAATQSAFTVFQRLMGDAIDLVVIGAERSQRRTTAP